ncbi:T9SS type A sorting domain-containing protein [candidate division KSB1 bacterium]|nr:T9SS type A sorting domain-containing protein [candidate division KSB1 bacterium]
MPNLTKLDQNYPNPFNPTTTINFETDSQCAVKLSIYNITGTHVRELVSDVLAPGKYSVIWEGTDVSGSHVASGLYMYIQAGK